MNMEEKYNKAKSIICDNDFDQVAIAIDDLKFVRNDNVWFIIRYNNDDTQDILETNATVNYEGVPVN